MIIPVASRYTPTIIAPDSVWSQLKDFDRSAIRPLTSECNGGPHVIEAYLSRTEAGFLPPLKVVLRHDFGFITVNTMTIKAGTLVLLYAGVIAERDPACRSDAVIGVGLRDSNGDTPFDLTPDNVGDAARYICGRRHWCCPPFACPRYVIFNLFIHFGQVIQSKMTLIVC